MRAARIIKTLTQVGVLGAAVLGCATMSEEPRRDRASTLRTPSTAVAVDPTMAPTPGRTSDVLTAAELATAGFGSMSLHDALARLRPGFLRPSHARTSMAARHVPTAVFLDGAHWGGPEALHAIVVSTVAQVQYVRAFDALQRFGPAYQGGVILVRLKR